MAKSVQPKRIQKASSYRLSPEAMEIIKEMSERLGISRAAVIEMAVRKLEQWEKKK
jgi:predicted DNA-binding protein